MTDEIKTKKGRGGPRKNAGRKAGPDGPKRKRKKLASTEAAKALTEAAKAADKPRKVGRPATFPDEVYFDILAKVAAGQTLTSICASDDMPDYTTVWRWKEQSDEFRKLYARAREDQQHYRADEIIDISDDGSRDYGPPDPETGFQPVDHDHIQRAKLRVDSRKWLMAKLAPSSYGERVALEHSGKDGAPLTPVINVTIGGTEPTPTS